MSIKEVKSVNVNKGSGKDQFHYDGDGQSVNTNILSTIGAERTQSMSNRENPLMQSKQSPLMNRRYVSSPSPYFTEDYEMQTDLAMGRASTMKGGK